MMELKNQRNFTSLAIPDFLDSENQGFSDCLFFNKQWGKK